MDRFEQLHEELGQMEQVEGISALEVSDLPDPFGALLKKMIRQGSMTVEEMAAVLGLDAEQSYHFGNDLAAKGYLQVEERDSGDAVYRVYLARIRKRSLPLDF